MDRTIRKTLIAVIVTILYQIISMSDVLPQWEPVNLFGEQDIPIVSLGKNANMISHRGWRFIEVLNAKRSVIDYRIVRISPNVIDKASAVTLSLFSRDVDVTLGEMKHNRHGGMSRVGRISAEGGGGDNGTALFVVRGDNVTGSINIGNDTYKIMPLGRGLHALILVDYSVYEEHPNEYEE